MFFLRLPKMIIEFLSGSPKFNVFVSGSPKYEYFFSSISQNDESFVPGSLNVKVSGPFVETSCVFQCIKNINAEMWA